MFRHRLPRWFDDAVGVIVTAAVVALVLLVPVLAGLRIGRDDAVRTAEANGLADVRVVDVDRVLVQVRGCGESDIVSFDVVGTNAAGQEVEALVCFGLLKRGTFRA